MHKDRTGRRLFSVGRCLSAGLVFILASVGVYADSTLAQPINADALQQLQQMQQQSQSRVYADPGLNQPPSVTLQPAVPTQTVTRPASRLEQILSARAGVKLQQFGYDQLGSGRAVTIPMTGAIQDDYILGPGDEIVVSLRGQENGEYRSTVDRNGRVLLPRLSPLPATGRSFGSFRADLEGAVHRAYVATEASVAVGRVRQISVLVSGEVNQPGPRLVTGLSSATDAILLAGGIRKTGSLRNVRIVRGGREYTVDLYGVLTARGGGGNFRLADGDRIVVPALGRTVAISGLVRQPGIYELPARSSVVSARALIDLAGGYEVRGRFRLSLLRVMPDGRTDMTQLGNESVEVHDSEVLFVQLAADQTVSRATLAGGTSLAGAYPIIIGTKLSQVLAEPGALGTSPYTLFGLIVRKNPVTLMPSLIAFTPVAVLGGREDMALQSDDLIRVLSNNEAQLLRYIVQSYLEGLANQQAAIRNPLGQNNPGDTLAQSITMQSGQQSEIFDVGSVPANVQRQQITLLLNSLLPGSVASQRQVDLQRTQRMQQQVPLNQSYGQRDTLNNAPGPIPPQTMGTQGSAALANPQIPQQTNPPVSANSPAISANNLAFPANDDAVNQSDIAENFATERVDTDRFASNREVQTFGQLTRQLGIDPLVLVNFLVDCRVKLDGAVRGPGSYFVGPTTSLQELVQAAGGTVNWADESGVELISTAVDRQSGRSVTQHQTLPLHQGTLASYVVRPRDQIHFSQTFSDVGLGTVAVQGEVRFPGSFPIIRGEHLSELLARAGGLTNTAYPYGTVFLRQSVAQKEREGFVRAASEVQTQLIVAMTRIGSDKIDPNTFASMQSFVTELRNQRGVGRISIVADPSVLAANPGIDPLLEAGDVVYIPPRPSTVTVLGQVLQPGSYPYRPGESVGSYIERAGGYASTADESRTYVVLPDGSARRLETSWLRIGSADKLPPGSSIVVPRDVTPLDLRQTIIDVSQIFSQFAVAIASVAVLSKQ